MKILDVPQSGSVGARTSSRNSSGQYVRQRAMPTQPRTASQVNQRARLTAMSAGWRGLTGAQQSAWIAFGQSFTVVNSLGTPIHLTGTQCYIKVNAVNLLLGRSAVSTPPALPSFVAATTTGTTAVAATPAYKIQGANPAAGTTFMLFASPQLSPGVNFNGIYRFLVGFNTFTTGNFDATTVYTTKFGALISGKKIFTKIVQEQSGMQDNGTIYTVVVT